MKTRSLLVLVGLAVCSALPVLAQENDRGGLETRQEIEAVLKMREEAINENDAAKVAAFYTRDATSIRSWESEGGLASGRQAIEKRYATELSSSPGEFVTSWLGCVQQATRCALSRKGVGDSGKVTMLGFTFGMPIAGRSVWNTLFLGDIDRSLTMLPSELHHTVNQLRVPPVAVATDLQQLIEILHWLAVRHLQPLESKAIHGGNIL